jgi:hypothetical protein
MKKHIVLGIVFVFCLFNGSLGHAALLLPGGLVQSPIQAYDTSRVLVASDLNVPVTIDDVPLGLRSGTLSSWVWANDSGNPYGGLTFEYLLQFNAPIPPEFDIRGGFAGFVTDVLTDPIARTPSELLVSDVHQMGANRTTDGQTLQFVFYMNPIGPLADTSNSSSGEIFVRTDARDFGSTTVLLGDEVAGTTFVPRRVDDQTASVWLLSLAGTGLLLMRRSSQSARPTLAHR